MISDIFIVFYWWLIIFILGGLSLPLTFKLFDKFWDKGWIFAKTISILILSYTAFVFGRIRILPFYQETLFLIILVFGGLNLYWLTQNKNKQQLIKIFKKNWRTFIWQEAIFLGMLLFWSVIRGFQPNIEGLEKFMDFGFVNSILRTKWFPPADMWFAGESINYYYFGHLVAAVLTKLSSLNSSLTYNLMIGTIFAQAFTGTFSLASNLIYKVTKLKGGQVTRQIVIGGLISAMLLTLGGNLHTITYVLKDGAKNYWYPNATRFIGYEPDNPKDKTIHEFPMYSFVVSDLHGHVNDIPVILLFLAVLLSLGSLLKTKNKKFINWDLGLRFMWLAFLLAVMYMTSSWEFPIYGVLLAMFVLLIFIYPFSDLNFEKFKQAIQKTFYYGISTLCLAVLFALPFALSFSPMADGVRFVDANSLWWQLLILWGLFWFITLSFWGFIVWSLRVTNYELRVTDLFVLAATIWATILIIIPEIIYVKDIYVHEHHRSNTMFKLVYQSFIMYSVASGYIFFRVKKALKNKLLITRLQRFSVDMTGAAVYLLFFTVGFAAHLIYPYFSIKGYYGNLRNYQGLYGMAFLENHYPDNYEAVLWLNKNIDGQPVILEAAGDSYTLYNHFSAMTGLPTIQGWTVHQWLWRGGYERVGRRVEEVRTIYQGEEEIAHQLLKKYQVEYVVVGPLENEKYQDLNEERFSTWGELIFSSGETTIYQLNL